MKELNIIKNSIYFDAQWYNYTYMPKLSIEDCAEHYLTSGYKCGYKTDTWARIKY